jgi:ArsR family transcriptional regulator
MSSHQENDIRFKSIVFYALSDSIRLEILEFLRDGEKCVCEIVPKLNLIQPLVSRHLRILKETGIIRCRKDSTKRFYSIVNPKIFNVVDNMTPDLIDSLKAEILRQVVCT